MAPQQHPTQPPWPPASQLAKILPLGDCTQNEGQSPKGGNSALNSFLPSHLQKGNSVCSQHTDDVLLAARHSWLLSLQGRGGGLGIKRLL